MKKMLIWILAVTIFISLSASIGFAFQNEPDGFRGVKWGDPPGPKMEFLNKSDEWLRIYQNPSDKLELGDARFYMILYQFYAPSPPVNIRKLMGVGLYFKNKENFNILETICKAKFGEPTSERFYEFYWVSLAASVILSYDSIDEDGYLALGSSPMFKQYTEDKEKKQVEEAEKDW